jgi:L-lactate utilization protein LutC
MKKWNTLASDEVIEKTVTALNQNGINALVVENGEEARKKVLELIPQKAEVMTMTSVTLDTVGVTSEIDESGKYVSLKKKLYSMNRETQSREMQVLGAAPEWSVGSVHAVTEDGHILTASRTGSQMPAYVYGSDHVIWVVGAQKIVKNVDEGMQRIFEHSLLLEKERAKKAYGIDSEVGKILILYKEIKPKRITLIFVKEVLGF